MLLFKLVASLLIVCASFCLFFSLPVKSEAAHHTLNTLKHVTMMRPDLAALTTKTLSHHRVVGVNDASWRETFVHLWSCDQVKSWLGAVAGGKFAHIVLPTGTTGKTLLHGAALLRAARSEVRGAENVRLRNTLASLFASGDSDGDTLRSARSKQEGDSWVLGIETFGGVREEGDGGAPQNGQLRLNDELRLERSVVVGGEEGSVRDWGKELFAELRKEMGRRR